MIANCGLPSKSFDSNLIDTAFQAYRNKDQRTTLLPTLGAYGMRDAKITMVGFWDTVGSLGIPSVIGGVAPLLQGFLDTSLHPDGTTLSEITLGRMMQTRSGTRV